MFSLIELENMNGSYSTYAIEYPSRICKIPSNEAISFKRHYNKVVFPLPILPTTPIRVPYFMERLISLSTGLTSDSSLSNSPSVEGF